MNIDQNQLKDFIIDSGLVSRADIEEALKDSAKKGESLGVFLVNRGKLKDDDLRRMHAHILGMPFVDLKGQRFPFDVLSFVPEPISRTYNIIAFKKTGDSLEVAMLEPEKLSVIDFIKSRLGLKVAPRLTDVESMKHAILQYHGHLKSHFGDLIAEHSKILASNPGEATVSAKTMVETLLRHAVLQKASDIHIEPGEQDLLVRYRILGRLHEAMILPKGAEASLLFELKSLAGLTTDRRNLPQHGRFSLDLDGTKVSIRISTAPTFSGEKVSMHILSYNTLGFTLEHLDFHGAALEDVSRLAKSGKGMILVTGPTGSGKTTTLYTLVDMLNTPDTIVSTIEDPIEYRIPRVNQTQVRSDIGLSSLSGLRTILSQDPDVVMVGSLEDKAVAALAVNAALSGKTVLCALPVETPVEVFARLADMNAPLQSIASAITLVIGQRLVRRLSDTKEPYALSKSELATLRKRVDLDRVLARLKGEKVVPRTGTWENISFWRPKKGLSSEESYDGKIGIHEVLKVSPAIQDILMQNPAAKWTEQITKQAENEGAMTLLEDGIFKCVQGLTTLEEILNVVR